MGGEPASTADDARPRSRLTGLRSRVRALPGGALIWRIAITAAGVLVIAVGVILLPLPGPGWVIIFAGLGLLATEYSWAARLLAWARALVVRWTRWAARQPLALRIVLSILALAALLALVVGTWWLYTVV